MPITAVKTISDTTREAQNASRHGIARCGPWRWT
jgi:hypothetical protein